VQAVAESCKPQLGAAPGTAGAAAAAAGVGCAYTKGNGTTCGSGCAYTAPVEAQAEVPPKYTAGSLEALQAELRDVVGRIAPQHDLPWPLQPATVALGLGPTVALRHRSSALYQDH
jgi:hypothetical protein